uniref:G-patch domain-containing protein n=1 Tax=Caenorhabditis japonica TaxID=281687 RepID=A0A8R1HKX2_CAEJA
MLREAANEVLQSRIPHGFVLYPNYDQYWSEEQKIPEDQTVYQLNPEGTEYVLVERRKSTYWASRSYRKRAIEMLGETEFKKFDQEDVNVCEMAFGMVDKIVRQEEMEKEREYLKSIADNKVALMQHRINKVFKGNRRRKNPHRQYVASFDEASGHFEYNLQVDDYFDWEDAYEDDSDDELSAGEEQAVLMHQEGYDQPPCMRVMDQLRRLHIITISGGYIGSGRDCEVVLANQLLPEICAEFGYSEEAGCYSIQKLDESCILQVNGNSVQIGATIDLCQGDTILLSGERFDVHVHMGSNTCSGCEPGLYQEPEKEETILPAKHIRGEVARRKQLKQMMKSYGIRPDEGLNEPIRKKATGPSHQNITRTERPSDDGDMYGSCAAKPLPDAQRKFDLPPTAVALNQPSTFLAKPLDSGNVGFKLLKSMGWSEGQGLGKEKQGHVEPVATELKNNRHGLGAVNEKEPPKTYKDTILEKTKQRFNEKR